LNCKECNRIFINLAKLFPETNEYFENPVALFAKIKIRSKIVYFAIQPNPSPGMEIPVRVESGSRHIY